MVESVSSRKTKKVVIGRQRKRTANNVLSLERQKKLISGGNDIERPTTWSISPLFERKNYDIGWQYNIRRPKKCVLQAKTLMISGGNE